jgi:hypothetical protein
MRTLGMAIAAATMLGACGGDNDATDGDAARACDGLAAVTEATKTGDEQAIRDGFEDILTAANDAGDDELTSLVEDLRAADREGAFVHALLDISDYCDQLSS